MSITQQESSLDRLHKVLEQRNRRANTNDSLGNQNSQTERLMQTSIATAIGAIALFGCAFLNLADLTANDAGKVLLDNQVLIKLGLLAVLGIYGALGFLSDVKVRKALFKMPVLWMAIILGFYLISVPGSVMPRESLASTISIGCVLLGTIRAITQLGRHQVLRILFFASALFVVVSWLLFLFAPQIGVFFEPLAEEQFRSRMGGMAHPNTLGQFAGLSVILGLLLYRVYGETSIWHLSFMALAASALVFSFSRSSILACAVAAVVVFRAHAFQKKFLPYCAFAGLLGIIGLLFVSMSTDLGSFIEYSLTSSISKSGDTDELITGNGRLEIWSYTTKLIFQEPITGYGAATSKMYLDLYSFYTHNIVLNVMFSTGVFGGLACILMIASRAYVMLKRESAVSDGVFVFIVANGIAENVIFSILCGLPTIAWIFALATCSSETVNDSQLDNSKLCYGSLGGIQ